MKVKPFWTTSEFWLTFPVPFILMITFHFLGYTDMARGMAGVMVLGIPGYSINRAIVKKEK